MELISIDKVELIYNFLMKDEKFATYVKDMEQAAFEISNGFGNPIMAKCIKPIPSAWGRSKTNFTEGLEYKFFDRSKSKNCLYYAYNTSDNDTQGYLYNEIFEKHFEII